MWFGSSSGRIESNLRIFLCPNLLLDPRLCAADSLCWYLNYPAILSVSTDLHWSGSPSLTVYFFIAICFTLFEGNHKLRTVLGPKTGSVGNDCWGGRPFCFKCVWMDIQCPMISTLASGVDDHVIFIRIRRNKSFLSSWPGKMARCAIPNSLCQLQQFLKLQNLHKFFSFHRNTNMWKHWMTFVVFYCRANALRQPQKAPKCFSMYKVVWDVSAITKESQKTLFWFQDP